MLPTKELREKEQGLKFKSHFYNNLMFDYESNKVTKFYFVIDNATKTVLFTANTQEEVSQKLLQNAFKNPVSVFYGERVHISI